MSEPYDTIQTPWGVKPPKIVVSVGSGYGSSSSHITFSHYPGDKKGVKFWDFVDENPKSTLLDGRTMEYKRGVRLVAKLSFTGVEKSEFQRIVKIYNDYNSRVNKDVNITLYLHSDDDKGFNVRFRRPPQPAQIGIYPGVVLEFEGTELLENVPEWLKSSGTGGYR